MIGENDVARHWDNNSNLWADQVRKGFDIYRETVNNPSMFQLIGSVKGLKILDAGCGEGYNTRKLARLGAQVFGIDISSEMIAHAEAAEKSDPLGISYQVCSFSCMEIFEKNTYDMTVAFMSLMDGPDYLMAIKELYRVLKPHGMLAFSITHPCFLTEGMSWETDEKGEAQRLRVGNYFSKMHYVEKWKFSLSPEAEQSPAFNVPYFPRTLSEYLNTLLDVGFHIEHIEEPVPTEEACQRFPGLAKWKTHAAIFLQVKARK